MGPRIFREEGSRWWRIDLRPWNGKRQVMRDPEAPGWPARGDRTELEETAELWRLQYLGSIHRGEQRRVRQLGPEVRTVGEAVDLFLAHRQATVERATFINDRTATGHLLEHFGRTHLTSAVDIADLQAIVDSMLDAGYETSTLGTYKRAWRLFFEFSYFGVSGMKLREVMSRRRLAEFYDPTEGLTLPKRGKVDVFTLSDEQIPAVLRAARKVDAQKIGQLPSAVTACGIGLFMGLREGEIFALSGQAIDAAAKTVRVQFQVEKDRYELKPTKGKNARTALVLPGWWELHQPRIGLLLGRGGRPVGSGPRRDMVNRVLDTAGVNAMGLGWHLLRHTYSRVFLESGGSMEQLQKSLGHSSIRTTEAVYDHLQANVAARLARERVYGA